MPRFLTRALAGAFALGVVACELLVPDTLPPFTCSPDNTSCPPGMICDLATSTCGYGADGYVPPDTGVADVGSEQDTSVPPDAPAETGVCRALGCTCSGPTDCDSRICADQTTVTPTLYTEVNHGFCIAPCCTSADCTNGFVCFATAAGGNYCVDPALLKRSSTLGSGAGGSSCSVDSQCRSGLCASGNCQDTCCSMFSSSECSSGSQCRYGNFPGNGVDTHFAPHCTSTGGTLSGGIFCASNSWCKSDLCFANFCEDACRSSADCGSGAYCGYAVDSSNDILAGCFTGTGATALGGACTTDSNCATSLCDPTTKLCTDVCYGTSDCAAKPGWVCRPETLQVSGGGVASVLLCGAAL